MNKKKQKNFDYLKQLALTVTNPAENEKFSASFFQEEALSCLSKQSLNFCLLWTVSLVAGELITAGTTNISSETSPAGTPPERLFGMARPFKARARRISGVELIWANGELDGKLSQIVDKIASSH